MKFKQIVSFLGSHWLWWPFARRPWLERLSLRSRDRLSRCELVIAVTPYIIGALLLLAGIHNYSNSPKFQQRRAAWVKQQQQQQEKDNGMSPFLQYWFYVRPMSP
ncbi:MAG: hypothetical protein A3I26_00540 [Candidatus Yanofskybacteria bacterium RIFCSPLOWO2_02_FULL_43_10]|nr:MAG: hypothetical protein A2742_00110 [Candidatus Yanofskybacteria bacterium RIFCSPHIGHO2_01_FULL_43_32]OGN10969.1 MAG: hypothetical protein A3C69_03250 [Candidatus Yanofskybacteria bacterium RIFCSPHIGHO2_02_FULL_43_12]OGN17117.1 MAG: hypothetical protein A3E34_03560 [Candidatus Yanofskybacteria bacterium RIFCSPHIGHO2_12_FULL_43_11]OGN24097.1 MAG: hypothetical protein A2923_02050 [Candidatus Yanofskybacteria bacterium RIFCSPLOWO2_01_FULL_43_46]OGN30587.1 MAG: hypothetical protein A3I26_00540